MEVVIWVSGCDLQLAMGGVQTVTSGLQHQDSRIFLPASVRHPSQASSKAVCLSLALLALPFWEWQPAGGQSS